MSKKPKRIRRTFSDKFKQDAVNLVVKQGYSFAAAAKAVDVSSRSLREWHAQLAPEPGECPPNNQPWRRRSIANTKRHDSTQGKLVNRAAREIKRFANFQIKSERRSRLTIDEFSFDAE